MSAHLLLSAHPTPALPLAEVWLPYAEALTLCQRTTWWMRAEVKAGRVRSRESYRRLANGRYDREVLLSTLPAAARDRHAAQLAREGAPSQLGLPLFGRPQLVTRTPRVQVPAHKMSEAETRLQYLKPILDMQVPTVRAACSRTLRLADGREVSSAARMIEYQIERARLGGVELSVRTLKRWLAAYRSDSGVAGLARRQRVDRGRSRFFDRPENAQAAALIAYLHLGDGIRPGLSAQACFDMLHAQRETVGLTLEGLPHYDTVRNFLGRITPALKVFALRGRQEFAERMLPYVSRAYTEFSNQWWVSDTMIADVEVLNDCIAGAPALAPVRLRLTAIIDFRSRYLVGYSWAWEGSSASITSALRHAVEHAGPCTNWYCDNGKDYCKVAAGAVPGYMRPGSAEAEDWALSEMVQIERTGILSRLGIQVTHCLPHHPQSKHVERFFRTVHLTFCRLWQTYTGGKPSERPDQTTALMADTRRKLRAGDAASSHHPLASELLRAFEAWVRRYHAKQHRGRGMDGLSPAEVFAANRMPNQRPAPTPEELAVLLMERKRAKVLECQVRVNKHDYVAPIGDPHAARLMLDRCDQHVTVAYDPLDPARVAVLDSDMRLVTVLEAKQLLRQAPDDPATQLAVQQIQQQRGALVRGLKQDRLEIVRAGKQLGVLHPLQQLDNEAGALHITPRRPSLRPNNTAKAPESAYDIATSLLGDLL